MNDRKRISPALIVTAVVIVIAVVLLVVLIPKKDTTLPIRYLASSSTGVPYYYRNEEENRLIRSSDTLKRGTRVTDLQKDYTENGIEYAVIEADGNQYFIMRSALVDDPADVIQETEVWARTSATVYAEEYGPEIVSYAKKGTCLDIVGFDEMLPDGSIQKYEVEFTDSTGQKVSGWVYGKYMVPTEEEALEVNTEYYEIHEDRKYSAMELYGGEATTLDWYPVEKPNFASNPICENASAMYINIAATKNIDDYIDIAEKNGVNVVVIDVKDEIRMAYPCEEIREICPSAYNNAFYGNPEAYKNAVQKCLDAGLYCVGRIVTFKDTVFAVDNPEECITSDASSQTWPSAYSRSCWQYNVTLALAAAKYCGFNEIQFDYLRFPEQAYAMSESGDADFKNRYNEEKAEAIQNFCYYASDTLHAQEVYMSVDVFGECANAYVTAYGQYYPAISLVVDAISAMPYPDHYSREEDTWTDPYPIMYDWARKAAKRRSEVPTPAIDRTWVAAYDVPFWNPTVNCDANYIARQVQGLADGGLEGGFITWNADSSLSKYSEIANAWDRTYTPSY